MLLSGVPLLVGLAEAPCASDFTLFACPASLCLLALPDSTGYCIAFIYNWRIALLITGAGPLVAVGGILHMKLIFGQSTDSDKLYGTANSAVTEAVSSIRVIQVRLHTACTRISCARRLGAGLLCCQFLLSRDVCHACMVS